MKRLTILSLLLSLIVLSGCQPSGPSSASGSTTGTSTDGSSTTGTAETTAGATTGGETKPSATVTVPDDLKNDAYHWLGLGNSTPIKYTLTAGSIKMSGSQTTTAKSASDGKVLFSIERDGELNSALGNEEWSLEKDGVYAVSNTKVTTPVRELQAPAVLTPGKTWTVDSKAKMDSNGVSQDVAQNLRFKVVGPTSVTTPVGKQDALLVTATGTLKLGEESNRVEASFWYVKDKGMVKNVLKRSSATDKKAPPTVVTIEEAK